MRYIILILLCVLSADAQVLRVKRRATAGCSTQKDVQSGGDVEAQTLGYASNSTYGAFPFTAGSSYTLCGLRIRAHKTNSPTFLIYASIYSDSGSNSPNAKIGTGSTAVSSSTFSTSPDNVDFSGLSASLSSGVKYWIVLDASDSPRNYSPQVGIEGYSGSASDVWSLSADGSTWGVARQYIKINFITYSGS